MLSYRHAYHAGNSADVLKHLVLVQCLDYLVRKDAPLLYVDTHAGAGRYRLDSEMARKNREFERGILAIDAGRMPESYRYFHSLIARELSAGVYPGSAWLAARVLRSVDRLRLFELHSTDAALLSECFAGDRRVRVEQSDGFAAIRAQLPAREKRALILIDPSYELKSDYAAVVDALSDIRRRMATAVTLLWYPVVGRRLLERTVQRIAESGVRDLWRYELCWDNDHAGRGMTGSGMLAVNPPWPLAGHLHEQLPALQVQMAPVLGHWRVEQLVSEAGERMPAASG